MPKRPAGVCANRGHGHQNLERIAARVREYIKFSPAAAINTLRLFDGLDDITVQDGTGRVIPLRGNVIELKDSEGFTKYDSDRQIIEILASTETVRLVGTGLPAWRLLRRARAGTLPAAHKPARASGANATAATGGVPSRRASG